MNAHTITFDKLVYLDRLKSAGVSEEVARAHAEGLDQALRESVATKSDLEKTETALRTLIEKTETALRSDLEKTETALRSDLENVETKLDAKIDTSIEKLRTEIERSKNSLLMWLIPFLLTGILPSLYTALKAAGIIH